MEELCGNSSLIGIIIVNSLNTSIRFVMFNLFVQINQDKSSGNHLAGKTETRFFGKCRSSEYLVLQEILATVSPCHELVALFAANLAVYRLCLEHLHSIRIHVCVP